MLAHLALESERECIKSFLAQRQMCFFVMFYMGSEKQDLSGPLTQPGLQMYNYIDQGEIAALRKKAGPA